LHEWRQYKAEQPAVGNLQRATDPVDAILNLGKVAVDAVFSELVSGQNSLLTGNLTGKS
jgi:hypothetical protein